MKNTIILLSLIIINITFAQQTYIFGNGGSIFQNGVKISPDQIRTLLAEDQKTLEIYNIGRTKKTAGNVFIYGGIATVLTKFLIDATTTPKNTTTPSNYYGAVNVVQEDKRTSTGYLIGGALLVSGCIIKGGFSKKIRKTVTSMNQNQINKKTTSIDSSSIILNDNGIGMSFTF